MYYWNALTYVKLRHDSFGPELDTNLFQQSLK